MAGMGTWGEAIFAVSDPKDKQTIQEVIAAQGKHRKTNSGRKDEVNDQPMTVTPSATEQNLQALTAAIDEAFAIVERIEHRISPILLTEVTEKSVEPSRGYPSPTPISERLSILCRRMDDLLTRMNSIVGRVDL